MESVTKNIGLRMTKIVESGIIGMDGKLRLPMDRVNGFLAANKGRRAIVTFESVLPGSSDALLGYYYGYVVPSIRESFKELGERKNDEQTDEFLVERFPNNHSGIEQARQFDQSEMLDFLEWLKQYAAENLYVYIEDPRTL